MNIELLITKTILKNEHLRSKFDEKFTVKLLNVFLDRYDFVIKFSHEVDGITEEDFSNLVDVLSLYDYTVTYGCDGLVYIAIYLSITRNKINSLIKEEDDVFIINRINKKVEECLF